jgi:uncharacterized repeat protein (TIGR03837 family)
MRRGRRCGCAVAAAQRPRRIAAMSKPAAPAATHRLDWDVFCRVVDNHGDLGVCWRLACRLAALGQRVRLWADDAQALAWMAPAGAPGVTLHAWRSLDEDEAPADVVVETFGADLPDGWLARMASAPRPPLWIDLEHLSAESYVERSHALPSPQAHGPGAGLTRWFFFPGFTTRTGGLLLEDGLAQARVGFDAPAWLAGLDLGIASEAAAATTISLFCYEQPALRAWLAHWRRTPTRLLVTPGYAAQQIGALLGAPCEPGVIVRREALTAHFLPWLTQPDYDRLLWACDLNHVRGEDSFVRALWAARPFVWQAYPQHDGAHVAKVEAFVDRYAATAPGTLGVPLRQRFAGWNGSAPPTCLAHPDRTAWAVHAAAFAESIRADVGARGDLAVQLHRFAMTNR